MGQADFCIQHSSPLCHSLIQSLGSSKWAGQGRNHHNSKWTGVGFLVKGHAGNFGVFNTSASVYSCDIFDKDFGETIDEREGRSEFECSLLENNWHKIVNEETRKPAKAGGKKSEHGKTSGLVFLVPSL